MEPKQEKQTPKWSVEDKGEAGPNPEVMMSSLCPVCWNPVKAIVYSRDSYVETARKVGPSPGTFEREVDTFIRTELYACGLERSLTFAHGRWIGVKYNRRHQCANAQGMALRLRESVSDDIAKFSAVAARHEGSERRQTSWFDNAYPKKAQQNVAQQFVTQHRVAQQKESPDEEEKFEIVEEGDEDQGAPEEPQVAWCKCGEPARSCSCP